MLRYTGDYDPECTSRYGRGQVVRFRSNRTKVTVLLIDEAAELYADWPIDETAPV